MSVVTHNFHAGDTVSVITGTPAAILQGIVIQVRITETSVVTVNYDVRLGDEAGTTTILESNMFTTLEEAAADYYHRLGGTTATVVGSPSTLTLGW